MTGALLELVARGVEDKYYICDPQITLFKLIYRRISNFSMYDQVCVPNGNGDFGTDIRLKFENFGDVLHKIWLMVDIPDILLEKTKSTFKYISQILIIYGIKWDYLQESDSAIVTLQNYNGGTVTLTGNLITDIMTINSSTIVLKSGMIFFPDGTKERIESGSLNLTQNIGTNNFVTKTISGGYIKLINNSIFGDVMPIVGGTIDINISVNNVTISNLYLISSFTNSIINAINLKIQSLIETYNFFTSAVMMTKNSNDVINKSTEYIDTITNTTIDIKKSIKTQLTSGRNFFMYLMSNILSKYSQSYSDVNKTNYFPIENDNYIVPTTTNLIPTKKIQLYSSDFKNAMILYGLLEGAICSYSYDTLIYNANYLGVEDSAIVNSLNGSFSSSPLFGDMLTRTFETQSVDNLIKFKLYNSDDIRTLYYITFINNIIRQKIVLTENDMIDFNPRYTTILKSSNISVSVDNLAYLDPDVISIDDVMLFYHTIDSDITNFIVYPYNVGENTNVYFDNNIGKNYSLYDKYNDIIQVKRNSYVNTDSYKIYKSYMQDVINNDIVNDTIKSSKQVSLITNILKYNIDSNIRYNFGQILNNISILNKANKTNTGHYILSFYRSYTSTTTGFTSTSGLSFTPIIDSSSQLLKDNFKNIINNVVNIQAPDGIMITNYFNSYIQNQIKTFTTSCQGLLRAANYDQYIGAYELWSKLLLSSGSEILSAYSQTSYNVTPSSSTFGKIALMNYIPLIVAKDIPKMIHSTFKQYAKQIMIDIGVDSDISSINYDNLLQIIDMRDLDGFDGFNGSDADIFTTPETMETKKYIYKRIVDAVILTSSDGGITTSVDNSSYFSQLQSEKATGNICLLSCAIRPSTFFCQYSTQHTNGSGMLVDSDDGSDLSKIKHLPIEWLTQTYYQIMKTKIINFINELYFEESNIEDKKTLGINLLTGLCSNVINCFILRNNIVPYADYQNNNYSLLGLTVETNTTVQKYKSSNTAITITSPIYSDAISSIWYQVQKGFIKLFNELFNETLVSNDYYTNNLGSLMGEIYNYIKSTIIGTDGLNPYYESNINDYEISLPDSLLDSFVDMYGSLLLHNRSDVLNYVGELYPSVDTLSLKSGFDFYRLIGMGNPTVVGSKSYKITTYIKDYSSLYSHILNYYNTYKSITLIKNDNDSLLYTISTNGQTTNIGSRVKDIYNYDKASNITNYLKDHINLKYINSSSLDGIIKNNLSILNTKTSAYWNPDIYNESNVWIGKNSHGVYGMLDSLYNDNFQGNIVKTLELLKTIPNQNYTIDSSVDFNYNPFTSFYLHQWYDNLSLSTELIYGDFKSVIDLLYSKIYSNGIIPTITSQLISKNINMSKLYSDSDQNVFNTIECVSWFLFDLILDSSQINTYIPFKQMKQSIQKTSSENFISNLFTNISSTIINDKGALNTLQQLIIKYFNPYISSSLKNFNKISEFKPSAYTNKINSLNPYFDIKFNSNLDIKFYEISLNGNCIINTPLETRLLNLLVNTKPKFAWVKELGHKIAKRITFSIGGQEIETYTPELMHLVYNMSKTEEHRRGYDILIGNTSEMYEISSAQRSIKTLYIPINFYFCKNAGNSLQLTNLIYTDCTLTCSISDINELLYIEADSHFKKKPKLNCKILSRYVYLDDDERANIVSSKLEYLIEKHNYNGRHTFSQNNIFNSGGNLITKIGTSIDNSDLTGLVNIKLSINDPIKYLIFYIKFRDKSTVLPQDIIDWCTFGFNIRNSDKTIKTIKNPIKSITLKMNGVEREQPHGGTYYTNLIPYTRGLSSLNDGEFIYSFALYPLLLQPTGHANYSEIPNSSIEITFIEEIDNLFKSNKNLELVFELWGLSNNIFRCVSGMGGLVFVKP